MLWAEMWLDGYPDFIGGTTWDDVCTIHYVCKECGMACDIMPKEKF